MRKMVFASGIALLSFTSIAFTSVANEPVNNGDKEKKEKAFPALVTTKASAKSGALVYTDSLYNLFSLNAKGLDKDVFQKAIAGYHFLLNKGKISRPGILTIADYSQPSSAKRLYILDLNNGKVLHHTYVSHGKNSGSTMAKSFSNSEGSNMTSLGFMVTAETYYGSKGYSMRLDGQEAGFNDNVRNRAVVMHAAEYVAGARAKSGIMMGRSFGCPAVPPAENREIIDQIKGGTLFYSHGDDMRYAQASRIINADFDWSASLLASK